MVRLLLEFFPESTEWEAICTAMAMGRGLSASSLGWIAYIIYLEFFCMGDAPLLPH
jgi:hypothetical protein